MPARSERLCVFPERSGQPARIIDFPSWWDRGRFFDTYGNRMIDTGNPFYCDNAILLTGGEARRWDERCRERCTAEPPAMPPSMIDEMRRVEEILRNASWVIVESCEWESGMS